MLYSRYLLIILQAPRRAVCGTRGSLRTMHGGGSAPSCCAFSRGGAGLCIRIFTSTLQPEDKHSSAWLLVLGKENRLWRAKSPSYPPGKEEARGFMAWTLVPPWPQTFQKDREGHNLHLNLSSFWCLHALSSGCPSPALWLRDGDHKPGCT